MLVEREKVVEVIKNYGKTAIESGKKTLDAVDDIIALAREVEMLPVAETTEVKHGYWKPDYEYEDLGICSVCGSTGGKEEDYCSCCGAKMDGEKID